MTTALLIALGGWLGWTLGYARGLKELPPALHVDWLINDALKHEERGANRE